MKGTHSSAYFCIEIFTAMETDYMIVILINKLLTRTSLTNCTTLRAVRALDLLLAWRSRV